MRILCMADAPPSPDLGLAGTEYQTIKSLRRLGLEVDAVWEDELSHKIKHWNLHSLFELPLAYKKVMLKKLQQKHYDVIHVNQPYGYLAAKTLKKMKVKSVFIHRSHGFELRVRRDLASWEAKFKYDNRPFVRKILSKIIAFALTYNARSIMRYADGHIVYAHQCREYLEKEMSVLPERIAVIPAAPPPLFIESLPKVLTKYRLKHVLYVSQFAFFKAPMIVAGVMNKLASICDDLHFTWVCSRLHHPQVLDFMNDETRKRVKLFDWMPQENLIQLYDNHGIFLFPSFFEGFGKVFIEAMSRGMCVVAADNSGAHDLIKSGENGILVPTGDVETMVEACLDLHGNPELAERISSNASALAGEYTWERVAKETVAFYCERLKDKFGLGY